MSFFSLDRATDRRWSWRLLPLLLLGVIAGCSDEAGQEDEGASDGALTGSGELAPEVDDAISQIPWQSVGSGVSYKPIDSNLTNVLVIYGGYSAQEKWVQRWCDQVVREKNAGLAIGHLYAVKGPNSPSYGNHEIANGKLAAHLGAADRAGRAAFVAVIAHSSGTYVADELFANLKKGTGNVPAATIGKLEYFDLDGGGPADAALVRRFGHAYFVYGHDAKTKRDSHNASGMKALGGEYAEHGGVVQIDASGSGCDGSASGGSWCLHDTLINTKPHNPQMFDLARDYSDFSGPHQLVSSYLDPLMQTTAPETIADER